MLEDCLSLSNCEKLLKAAIQGISLVGQIPLTEEDINKLSRLIREECTAPH